MITNKVRELAQRSVICWLATSDSDGQPNVSPKEIYVIFNEDTILIANIASAKSTSNIRKNKKVCVSFIDIFVQKGFKIIGEAIEITSAAKDYSKWVAPLHAMAGDRYPIHSVLVVKVNAIEEILAPSYILYPSETSEESQIKAARVLYGL